MHIVEIESLQAIQGIDSVLQGQPAYLEEITRYISDDEALTKTVSSDVRAEINNWATKQPERENTARFSHKLGKKFLDEEELYVAGACYGLAVVLAAQEEPNAGNRWIFATDFLSVDLKIRKGQPINQMDDQEKGRLKAWVVGQNNIRMLALEYRKQQVADEAAAAALASDPWINAVNPVINEAVLWSN